MKRTIIILLSLLVVASMVLTACAPAPAEAPKEEAPKQEAPKQEAPKEETPKQEAPKEEKPAEQPAAASAVKELKIIWAEWDPSNYLQQLANEYEKVSGVKVTVVQEPWGTFSDRVFTEFAGKGASYDLVVGDSQWLGQGATQGHYVDISDIFMTDLNGKSLSPATVAAYAEYPAGSGKYWSYPTEGDAIGWSYRKDLFEDPAEKEAFKAKYGYDLDVPKTMTELRDIAEFFTRPDKNQYGIAVYTQKDYDGLVMGFEQALWNFGGDWGDFKTYKVDGIVNSEDSIKALEFYQGLYKFAPPGSSNDFFAESLNHFTSGEVAMAMNYFAFFPGLANPSTNKFAEKTGFFSNPDGPKARHTSLGGQGMSIVAYVSPERQAAAKEFLKWFAKDETQQKWAELGGYTCNATILKSDAFLNNTPYNKAFSESMLMVKDFWNVPIYVELLNVAKTALHKYVVGGEGTAKEALDLISAEWTKLFEENGYTKAGAEAPAAPAGGGKLVFIPKGSGNPFFDKGCKPGAEEAAKELGYELVYSAPPEPNADSQVQLIDAAVAAGDVKAIMVSANDPDALCPSLKKAREAGVVVMAWDSDVAVDCRQAFLAPADTAGIGGDQVKIMCDMLGGPGKCEGEVAILSAASTATNQNAWIEVMKEEFKKPDYAKMTLVATVYGDDKDQKSYDEALGLFKTYPNLKGIIAPTTVGVAAAGKAVTDEKLIGKVMVTGLGLPSQMNEYIKNGAAPVVALWNPVDLGYGAVYLADALLKGTITGAEGDAYKGGRLGDYKVGKDGVVILGGLFRFVKDNVDSFSF